MLRSSSKHSGFTAKLFKSKVKTPEDLVHATSHGLAQLQARGADPKVLEELEEHLERMKVILYGEGEAEPDVAASGALTVAATQEDFLRLLLSSFPHFSFEGRKDVGMIVTNLLRQQVGQNRFLVAEYLEGNRDLIDLVIVGCSSSTIDVALTWGSIIREIARHQSLARYILASPAFFQLFTYIELPAFEIASDAFATLKELLTRHRSLVVDFLAANYAVFWEHYDSLLASPNYLTRRQSVKLLGELLADKALMPVLQPYLDDPANLKLVMTLLKDPNKSIQLEAFQVFKVFVANPEKAAAIMDILASNQAKLLKFLETLKPDKDDQQLTEDKNQVRKEIEALQPRTSRRGSQESLGGSRRESMGDMAPGSSRRGSSEQVVSEEQHERLASELDRVQVREG
ncbi:Mo25 family protein [Klebsormidium nitens]|uniref:Mo25 family protein n=1 Tax=Klebsormidium nitens TaxID=105231 RepID=A0A1Y1I1L2_KLENI|nr:Mo25 family protein [Klebsormidium nitens]|eukprot:GAQ83329.1 Mo25 family protein [Klebsormidium nitens]